MWNFLLVHKYFVYVLQTLFFSYLLTFNCFITFCFSAVRQLVDYCIVVPEFQFRFRRERLSYSFCVLIGIPFEFLLESWVANEAPYYFIMQPWFDLFFFFFSFFDLTVVVFVQGIIYSFYVYLISLIYVIVLFDAVFLHSGFWLFIWYGGFIFFCGLALLFFFLSVVLGLYLIDTVFKTPVAGLVLLSREFIAIEDEDLWVSSNIFYMDMQIRKAKEFVLPLKIKEIEAFMTLVKLFFEEPLHDLQYGIFSGELTEFRRIQRAAFLEKKRLRESLRTLTPKRKFQRFKRHKRGGVANALLESQQNQFLEKTALNISRVRMEKHFYRFLSRNLRFSYIKPPTKKKRLKRLILFKNRIRKQQILSLRFKDRAAFSKRLNSVHDLRLSTDKLLPSISSSVTYMQPQILRNDLVKSHLMPRVNLKNFVFGYDHEKLLYNQYPKIPRFRRFFWFSLPFYLSITSSRFALVNILANLRYSSSAVLDWFRSKFLSIFFAIFEDSWAIGQFRIRNYSPRQPNLTQFLKLNNLSFIPLVDNPEDPEDGPLPTVQQPVMQAQMEGLDKLSASQSSRSKFRKKREQPQSKKGGSKTGKKENEKTIQKKRLKKKAYRKRLLRKHGTTRKNFLISRQRYHFSNVSNVAGIKCPELRLLDLYKVLEYFYFVLTNDSDFYEAVMFSAKVALLRDKYGQIIVSDLLEKADHKQASKVSVIMHVTEATNASGLPQNAESQDVELLTFDQDNFTDSDMLATSSLDRSRRRHTFKTASSKAFPRVSDFSRDLLLSYRYRFRF